MKIRTLTVAGLIGVLGMTGCATDQTGGSTPRTNTQKGAVIGAIGGAVAGAAIGHRNRGKGALIGAVGGGLAGAGVGAYMDSQRKDLQKVLASEVQSGQIEIAKQADNSLLVRMTSATAFDTNSSDLKSGFLPTLDRIANVVNTYGKTTLTIVGHTDNVGSDAYNQSLSERRAQSVVGYLQSRNVLSDRLDSYGKGEKEPRASNDNESGRQLNRRVEIWIVPIVENK